jgi:hypothetical protein
LDTAQKVRRELDNYRECTTLYIPFNQRPNLDPGRCVSGYSKGTIVGNFVEQSEPLQSVIDRGAGRAALHSLFDGALRGWHRQAFHDEKRYVVNDKLVNGLKRALPSSYREYRQKLLNARCAALGPSVRSFHDLQNILEALPKIRYRQGLTHGDLHGHNVRVAGHEAILIDFASIEHYGPITADPASLDVSLVIDTNQVEGAEWNKLAREIYSLSTLRAPLVPPRPEHHCASLLDSLHYIRQTAHTMQLDQIEYPVVVAVQLLRKASYRGKGVEQKRRRDFAYELANRLINEIQEACPANKDKTISTRA